MKMLKVLLLGGVLFLVGCAISANKDGNFMILRGWGAKNAEWNADGSGKISKEEPIQTPSALNP